MTILAGPAALLFDARNQEVTRPAAQPLVLFLVRIICIEDVYAATGTILVFPEVERNRGA